MMDENGWSEVLDTVHQALHGRGLFDIHAHAWSNQEDPNPDYLGYAMWEVDEPLDLFKCLPNGWGPVSQRPPDSLIRLAVDGEEFTGLMEMGRLSVGFAILFQDLCHSEKLSQAFWLHYTHALTTLGAASDRLRDYFIRGFMLKSPASCVKKHGRYVAPSSHAVDESVAAHADSSLQDTLRKLRDIAASVALTRDIRNTFVHRIGTIWGRVTNEVYAELQKQYDREQADGYMAPDSSTWRPSAEPRQLAGIGDPADRVAELVDGYKHLLEAGNLVFLLEHKRRNGQW